MRSEGVAIAASNTVQIQKTRFTVGTRRGRSTPRWIAVETKVEKGKGGWGGKRTIGPPLNFEARRKRTLLLRFVVLFSHVPQTSLLSWPLTFSKKFGTCWWNVLENTLFCNFLGSIFILRSPGLLLLFYECLGMLGEFWYNSINRIAISIGRKGEEMRFNPASSFVVNNRVYTVRQACSGIKM